MQIANHLKANLVVNDIQDVQLSPFQESLIQDGNFSAHLYPSLFFFRSGRTIASLNDFGTHSSVKDVFTISVITWTMLSKQVFRRYVGIWSNSHDLTELFG